MKSANFWSELGSGIGELGSTPPPGIPRNTPPGLRRSDPQPHRNISELTLSFLCGIWLIFVAKGPLVETKGCLLLGSDESPLNDYLLRYRHGSPASFLILFFKHLFVRVQLIPNLMQTGRYTCSTCLASNPLNPWGEEGTEQSFVLGSALGTKPLPLLYTFYNFPLTNGTPFTYLV